MTSYNDKSSHPLPPDTAWIDYFNGEKTPQTDWLYSSLGNTPHIMGYFVLAEVLQGFQSDKGFKIARDLLLGMPFMAMGGLDLALQSART